MLEVWASIAQKLSISEEDAILLHAFNRDWTSVWGQRRTYAVVSRIVERFSLQDKEYDKSYGSQLVTLGVLTPEEAAVFSGERSSAERSISQEAASAEASGLAAISFDDKS